MIKIQAWILGCDVDMYYMWMSMPFLSDLQKLRCQMTIVESNTRCRDHVREDIPNRAGKELMRVGIMR
jgi:hypothetical protein